MLSAKQSSRTSNFNVFCLTRPGIEPPTSRMPGERSTATVPGPGRGNEGGKFHMTSCLKRQCKCSQQNFWNRWWFGDIWGRAHWRTMTGTGSPSCQVWRGGHGQEYHWPCVMRRHVRPHKGPHCLQSESAFELLAPDLTLILPLRTFSTFCNA